MKSIHQAKPKCTPAPRHPTPLSSALARLDLNLLVAFDVLLVERSVTRAARRLGLTQSALSHMLGRLRRMLDDELLIKTPGGMVPTALALDLEAPLRGALHEIEQALRSRPRFEPATSRRQFTLASADYGTLVVVPRLMRRVAAAAPGVSLTVLPLNADSPQELATGMLDLVLGAIPPDVPDVMGRRLVDEQFICLVRGDHPQVRSKLSLDQYCALSHVLISPMGGGSTWVDPVLERLGRRRHIALRVPHYLVAPLIVAETDLIVTVARRVARALRGSLQLREVAPPVAIPGFSVSMYWHPGRSEDPGHRWLREQLIAVAGDVAKEDKGRGKKRRKA